MSAAVSYFDIPDRGVLERNDRFVNTIPGESFGKAMELGFYEVRHKTLLVNVFILFNGSNSSAL